jgi:hypothetical protein
MEIITCVRCGKQLKSILCLFPENMKGTDHLGDTGFDGRILL